MSDKMFPIEIEQLLKRILAEYKYNKTIFGINEFSFKHRKNCFKGMSFSRYGTSLDNPLGVAAGPQTQMAQNILASWLTGARYIELKTVQTLDELEIPRPCIDMFDVGYNCEWSQELKIYESYDEYLKAWILIHFLNSYLFKDTGGPGMIFNMSIGYNFEGIQNENIQNFLALMKDCSKKKNEYLERLSQTIPEIKDVMIPDRISNNITLSTMHGCPPDEIEKIGVYLINDLSVHTTIKLNPTLNGSNDVRKIINDYLGFKDIVIPDMAFEHDLKFSDGIKIIKNLKEKAGEKQLEFSIKLTNTLECLNKRDVFDSKISEMYMSGRALHAISVNLAHKLQQVFDGKLDISFSAGADAFNVPDILSMNILPITVCSDLLRPGGYERMGQYFDEIRRRMDQLCAKNLKELVLKTSNEKQLHLGILKNLEKYVERVINNKRYHQSAYPWKKGIKGERRLTLFDCVKAPCMETCPASQEVPEYMYLTKNGEYQKGLEIIRNTNPFPNATGLACDHVCEDRCTRMNYDTTLNIRDIKRFLATQELTSQEVKPIRKLDKKIAIIGAGPCGLTSAFYLSKEGFQVDIFESENIVGGMISRILPDFRTICERVNFDLDRILKLGMKVYLNKSIELADDFMNIISDYQYVILSPGAQKTRNLGIQGDDSLGVMDFLDFLSEVKEKSLTELPQKVVVVGGGNSAIDTVRAAKRLMKDDGELFLVYRRCISDMPANREEIEALQEESQEQKIRILELTSPSKIIKKNGIVNGIECLKMELVGTDISGRRKPVAIAGTEFTIDVDLIITAIGQINYKGDDFQNLERKIDGTIDFDILTYETSIKNVFIGGDAANGPTSIINSIADGKKIFEEIINREQIKACSPEKINRDIDLQEIRKKRSKRKYGQGLNKLEIDQRDGFDLVIDTFSEKEAQEEAKRCLYCHIICEVCVSVCPNRANISYEIEPKKFHLKDLIIEDNEIKNGIKYTFNISQKYQVLNIGNFCNECGNCVTFCPTKGRPYFEKPKIYLTRDSFQKAEANAFYFENGKLGNILFLKTAKENMKLYSPHDQDIFYIENKVARFIVRKECLSFVKLDQIKKVGNINMLEIAGVAMLLNVFENDLAWLF